MVGKGGTPLLASEILIRRVGAGEGRAYSELTVECSSAGAPWRDLVRLERGRKALAGVEVTLLWPTVAISHSHALLDHRMDDGALCNLTLKPGDVCVYPQGACLYVRTLEPLETTALQLAPGLLLEVAAESGEVATLRGQLAAPDPAILAIASLLEQEARSRCPSGRVYAEHLAYALGAHLVRRQGVAQPKAARAARRLPRGRLAAVLEYIHAHPGRHLSLVELAQAVRLSPFHFSRLFKNSTGVSPHQYVLQWRVGEAKRLLRHSRIDLAEIATRLGFGDQSHFTARFRQLTGETPKRWRESA